MKVLTVAHGFPPEQMAGAELYAFRTARGLRARGFDVQVLAPSARPGAREYALVDEVVDGIPVRRLINNFRDLHRLASTYANPEIEAVFEQVLAEECPDVVHIHHTIGTSGRTAELARARGAVVIITLHDFWYHCARNLAA